MRRTAQGIVLTLAVACGDEPAAEGDASETMQSTVASTGAPVSGASTTGATGDSSGSVPPGGGEPCDPVAQDCGDGFKCAPAQLEFQVASAVCVPIPDDPMSIGDRCMLNAPLLSDGTSDPCDAGSVCVSLGGEAIEGVCVELCTDESYDCSLDGLTCTIAFNGQMRVCLEACDPLGSACEDNAGCYYIYGTDHTFVCSPTFPGAGQRGDECTPYVNQTCIGGHICFDGVDTPGCAGTWCCTPYCDQRVQPDECEGPNEECTDPWGDGAPPGLEHAGICGLPL